MSLHDGTEVRHERTLELAMRYLRLLEAGDVEGAFELVHPDVRFWVPGPGWMDLTAMRAFFVPAAQLIERMVFSFEGSTVEGDRVALEVCGDAELKNGREYHNRYHFLFIVRGDRLAEVREYCDTAPAQVFLQ